MYSNPSASPPTPVPCVMSPPPVDPSALSEVDAMSAPWVAVPGNQGCGWPPWGRGFLVSGRTHARTLLSGRTHTRTDGHNLFVQVRPSRPARPSPAGVHIARCRCARRCSPWHAQGRLSTYVYVCTWRGCLEGRMFICTCAQVCAHAGGRGSCGTAAAPRDVVDGGPWRARCASATNAFK